MKIILVDDHEVIRNSVKKLLSKINSNYIVVGEADNGVQGIELIKELRPDLVIADIKMPIMTGIEMFEELKIQGISTKSIVLSGFAQFELAQKAVALGVNNYLLKPITVEEFKKVLDEVEDVLNKERSSEKFSILKAIKVLCNEQKLENQRELEELCTEFMKINISKDIFRVILLHITEDTHKDRLLSTLNDVLKDDEEWLVVNNDDKKEFILLRYEQNGIVNNLAAVERALNQYKDKDMLQFEYRQTNIKNLGETFNIMRTEIKRHLVKPLKYNTYHKYKFNRSIEKTVLLELSVKKYDYVIVLIENELDKMIENITDPEEITNYFIGLMFAIMNFIKDNNIELFNDIDKEEFINIIRFAVSKREILYGFSSMIGLLKQSESQNDATYSLNITKVIKIFKERYNQDISLEGIAHELKITPEYLSSLFSKETGIGFSLYLRNYRIEKAKQLLLTTDLKTYEISNLVGYNDVKYFCNVFKKVVGYSTRDYVKVNK